MGDNEHFKHAVSLVKQGEPDLAIKSLRPILRNPSNRGTKYAALAYCYETKRVYPKAIYLYTSALTHSPDGKGSAWTKRLQQCRNLHQQDLDRLQSILPPPYLEKAAWGVAGVSGLIAAGFFTLAIPILLYELFGVLIEDDFSLAMGGLFGVISVSALAYSAYCLKKRKNYNAAKKVARGEEYTLIENACPACNLNYRQGSIECPWCGFEKEIEQAKQYFEAGDYSRAYDCLREFYNHPDPQIKRRVEPLCNEYLRHMKEKEAAVREADLEKAAQSHISLAQKMLGNGQFVEARQTLKKVDMRTASYNEVEELLKSVDEGIASQMTVPDAEAPPLDYDALEKLGRLLESGAITDSEFEDEKKKLLSTGAMHSASDDANASALRPRLPNSWRQQSTRKDSIDQLPVSHKWKEKFHVFQKAGRFNGLTYENFRALSFSERFKIGFNIWAFLFSIFWYLAKGMGRKGLVILGAWWLIAAVMTFIEILLEFPFPYSIYFVGSGIVFGTLANYDYYRKMVHGDTMWKPFAVFQNGLLLTLFAIGSLVALGVATHFSYNGFGDVGGWNWPSSLNTASIARDVSGTWRAVGDGAIVEIDLPNEEITINGTRFSTEVDSIDDDNDIVTVYVDYIGDRVRWRVRQIWDESGEGFTLVMILHNGEQDALTYLGPL